MLITQYFPPEVGAAQTRLHAVTQELVRRGDEVDVVTAVPNYPLGAVFPEFRRKLSVHSIEQGVRVHRVWMYPAMGTGVKRLISYASFSASSLWGLCRARRPDVVVVESPPLFVAVPALLYGALIRRPVVVNVADLWPDAAVAVGAVSDGRILRAMFALERWVYRRARAVGTVTEGVRDTLLNDKRLPPEKIVLLPNGVDTVQFSPDIVPGTILVELAVPDRPFVVYAGTMGLAHGLDPLFDAMGVLKAATDTPLLLMIGAGSERDRLEQRAADEGLTNVLFRDPVPPTDLARLLPLAVAGVVTLAEIPLNEKSRPAKLFPLMAAGLPILFTGGGEGADAVRTADAGIVVPNTADAIAAGMRDICDPAKRAVWGENSRRAVETRWSWRQQIDAWHHTLRGLVDRERTS
ncbi:MAG: glycosyltransferase family 4 protein [Actinobacteria bacterium]|nr:glycosyltransferase family 4 protein [Actinomycetota bacterium]